MIAMVCKVQHFSLLMIQKIAINSYVFFPRKTKIDLHGFKQKTDVIIYSKKDNCKMSRNRLKSEQIINH